MYGISINGIDKNQNSGNVIYTQPLNSVEEVNALKEQLIEGDKRIERKHYYFPHVQQARKIEAVFCRVVSSVIGFFTDLITFPCRAYNYAEYKNELKKSLPIYQYLQNHGVPQKYLDQDKFEIVFWSGEKSAEPWAREGSLLHTISVSEGVDLPTLYRGRNFQEYETYPINVYNSCKYMSCGGGWMLLTDENRERLRHSFVAS